MKTPKQSRWDEEYARYNAIPSSRRSDPSKALGAMSHFFEFDQIGTVLDIGCGNGRNAAWLAKQGVQVIAIDFSKEALKLAEERVEAEQVTSEVELVQENIHNGLPVEDDSIDLILDSYTSCHFLQSEQERNYHSEILRVLQSGGQFYWSALSVEDDYYRQVLETHPADQVIVDPLNDMTKRLFTRNEADVGFIPELSTEVCFDLSFNDTVEGDSYLRRILSSVYRLD